MASVSVSPHSFCPGTAAAQDDIVFAEVKALKGVRVEEEIFLEMLFEKGQVLHERGAYLHFSESIRHVIGKVNGGIKRCLRESLAEDFHHPLSPTKLIEIVMDYCKVHG
jgi:hypothetical protein